MVHSEDLGSTYDDIADEYGSFYETMLGNLYLYVTCQQIRSYLQEPADGLTVLDMGCGKCTVARTLAEKCEFKKYVGVDISEEMVTHARDLVADSQIQNYRIEHEDILTYDYMPDHYDLVLAQGGVFSLTDSPELLETVARTLSQGGYGFLSAVTRYRYTLFNLWTRDWEDFVTAFDEGESRDIDGVPIQLRDVSDLKERARDAETLKLVDVYPKVSFVNHLPDSQIESVLDEHWDEIKRIELENAKSPDNWHGLQTEFVVRRNK